jgi:hypothetical protein
LRLLCDDLQEQKEERKEEPPKEEEKKEEPPELPEIVLKVDMHCEDCARKVQKSLRQFEGSLLTSKLY